MLWSFIACGIGLTIMGWRFMQWVRQIPDRNEDFDVVSPAADSRH